MTDDLISRQATLEKTVWVPIAKITATGETIYRGTVFAADIERLPSAEKRGKWERHWSRPGVYADLYWHCSACGGRTDMQWAHIYYKYCPYCGARMEDSDGNSRTD